MARRELSEVFDKYSKGSLSELALIFTLEPHYYEHTRPQKKIEYPEFLSEFYWTCGVYLPFVGTPERVVLLKPRLERVLKASSVRLEIDRWRSLKSYCDRDDTSLYPR